MLKWRYEKKDMDRSTVPAAADKHLGIVNKETPKRKSRLSKPKQTHIEKLGFKRKVLTCIPEGEQGEIKRSEEEGNKDISEDEAINNLAREIVRRVILGALNQIAREDRQQAESQACTNESLKEVYTVSDEEKLGSLVGAMAETASRPNSNELSCSIPADLLIANKGFRPKKGILYHLRKLMCALPVKGDSETQASEKKCSPDMSLTESKSGLGELINVNSRTKKRTSVVRRLVGSIFSCRRCHRQETSLAML